MIRTRRPARHRAPQPRRGLAGAVTAATAVVALVLTLTPSAGSQAQWYSEVQVAIPGATTDSLSLTLTPSSATTTAVTNGAAEQTVAWAPRALTVAPTAGSGTTATDVATLLRGSRVSYTGGASCTSPAATWTAAPVTSATAATITPVSGSAARATLAPRATGQLCLEVQPALTGTALTTALAGRTMTLTTTADSRSAAPATWTSPVATWTTKYQVPLPRPELRCSGGGFSGLTLSWTWAGTSAGSTPAINRWEIWRGVGNGSWELAGAVDGSQRSVSIRNGDISGGYLSGQDFMVRAYPFAGSSEYYAESTQLVRLERHSFINPMCLSTTANTSTNPVVLP